MTQLVGRILRQPHALKTGVDTLDDCHINTHQAGTADVITKIKFGLENDGLCDLIVAIKESDGTSTANPSRKIERRDIFSTTDVYLPKVLWTGDGVPHDLDYDRDILAAID